MSDENEKDIECYRRDLLECDNNSIGEYDKAVMTLSGGAVGLTFAFLKDIGTLQHIVFLLAAWTFWGVSITCVVFSHYFSHLAMRRALRDLNAKTLNYNKPGGCWDTAINILNPVAGGLFLAGLVSLLFFVSYNVKSETHTEQLHSRSTVVTTTTTTSTEDIDGHINTNQMNTNILTPR
jgi:hypothetical protein